MRKITVGLAALVVALLPGATAFGAGVAPAYVTSDPQNGATVDSPPSRVSVTFSEPLDSSSTLQVFDQCGRGVDAGDAQVLGSRIDVGIAQTPAGHYTAVYLAKGFGGATGETKGSFSFHVTSGAPCGGDDHDGHGGHGDGGGDDDGHGGHGGGDDHDGNGDHGDDGDHGSGMADHSGSGDDHDAHDDGGADHGDKDHGGKDHGNRHHGRDGAGHSKNGDGNGTDIGGNPELASGRGGPGLAPTSTSVLVALGLSIAMGAVGGWVLRVSAGS